MARAILGVLVACLAVPAWAAEPPTRFALRASRVYTGEEEIERGMVLVEDGKIAAVGRDLSLPPGVLLVDLPGRSLLPGLVDAETTLAEGGLDTRRSITPHILAADGWDLFADRRPLLRGGVTTVYVSPGERRLLSGRGVVVKTAGYPRDVRRRVLRLAAGLRVNLGERAKNPPGLYEPPVPPSTDRPFRPVDLQLPSSRGGEFLVLRSVLRRARALVVESGARAGGQVPVAAGALAVLPDPDAAALADVVLGREPLRIQVDRAHDIARALALGREMGVAVVLEGAREAYRVPELIREAKAPVILRGAIRPGRSGEEDPTLPSAAGQAREGTAALLARAGVPLAIDSPTDAEVDDLLLEALGAVREGLSPRLALRAVTLGAAEILGVADRVGSIAVGKDADLVVMPGESPLDPQAPGSLRPEAVFIGGELVFALGPRECPPGTTAIRCGRILTGQEEIPGGTILVREGKVLHVGAGTLFGTPLFRSSAVGAEPHLEDAEEPTSPPEVIDAVDQVVIPGMIDAGGQAGVRLDALFPELEERQAGGRLAGGGRSTYRLFDAVDLSDPALALLLERGITTVVLAPEPVGTVSGQLTAFKLGEPRRDAAVLRDPAGILFSSVRADDLQRAREYHERWSAHERAAEGAAPKAEGAASPLKDDALEPFRALFEGRAVAVAQARSRSDAAAILRELREKHRLPTVLFGLWDLEEGLLDDLRRQGAALLFSPPFSAPRAAPLPPLVPPRLAAGAGVRFAFRSQAAAAGRHLPLEAALAVREGLDPREALRALTVYPAQLFQLDGRIGSIEKGKDADLVFLTGDPFALGSRVARVMVGGRVVHEAGRRP